MTSVPDLLTGLLNPREAAGALKLAEITLAKWRQEGKGPPWCRVGSRVYYRESDLREWVDQEVRRSIRTA